MSDLKHWVKQSRTARQMFAFPIAARRAFLQRKMRPRYDVVRALKHYGRGDISIFIPEFDGIFQMSTASGLLHRFLVYRHYEPVLSSIFLKNIQPDHDVIDVGANVGFYTVGAAKRLTSGRVLAVEPTGSAHARLMRNVQVNGIADKVIVEKAILMEKAAGRTEIHVIPDAEEYSSLGGFKHVSAVGKDYVKEDVETTTLDTLVQRHGLNPKALKVDVEGAELKVLLGAAETIAAFKPYVLSECHALLLAEQGSSPAELFDLFYRHGYKIINPEAPSVAVTSSYQGDIVCIPPQD